MLKARAGGVVILGLSDRNLELLKAGKPIAFDGAELRLDGVDRVLIFHGKDEAAMEEAMREHFVIPG